MPKIISLLQHWACELSYCNDGVVGKCTALIGKPFWKPGFNQNMMKVVSAFSLAFSMHSWVGEQWQCLWRCSCAAVYLDDTMVLNQRTEVYIALRQD